jgi:hypothetical protein
VTQRPEIAEDPRASVTFVSRPAGRSRIDRVKGNAHNPQEVSHFSDSQQRKRASWGKSFSFAEFRFNGVGCCELPISM